MLHGLTGPIDNKTYTDVMMPMGVNNDEWVAAMSSFVRRSFGNTGGFVTPADVARVRAATAGRKAMWTRSRADRLAAGRALHGRLESEGEP